MSDIINRISGLLNKAENTDNEHEREAFMQKAQELATRAEIDLEVARQRTRKKENSNKVEIRRVEVGEKGDRGAGAYSELYVSIAGVNAIKCYYSNAVIDAYGYPSDLDYVETLYAFIVGQMVEACQQYIASDEWRVPGHHGIADARKAFYTAYRNRIADRLEQARRQAMSDADKYYSNEGVKSASLVLVDKKERVDEFYWNNVKGFKVRQVPTGRNRAARSAGTRAGSNARIASTGAFAGAKGSIEG